jgi:ribosome-associated toxin RatA of RatAB toxin-antitoxin module
VEVTAVKIIRNSLVLASVVTCLSLVTVGQAKAADSIRYSVRTPESGIEAGAAKTTVKAPASSVLAVVTDYGHWDRFISRFDKARVVGRTSDTVDVYLQVPILKGAAKIWAVVRFTAPKTTGTESVVEGHMVKGNVERLDAKWRVIQLTETTSELHLQMLIVPKMPLPGSLVTGEVAYAADKAILDVRSAAERR